MSEVALPFSELCAAYPPRLEQDSRRITRSYVARLVRCGKLMTCKACGKELPSRKEGRGRPRLFCDRACRFNAWIMRHGPYTPKPAPGIGRIREREALIREYYAKQGLRY